MKLPIHHESGQASFKVDALLLSVLLAIICVISWPGMTAPLLLDDNDQLFHVGNFKSWKDCLGPDCYGLFRPLKNFIFYFLADVPLFQWHAFTLAAYLGAVAGLYALFRQLLGAPSWAFAGALLWASSPTQVSTMVWMSAANLSLAMALSCACLIFHDRSQAKPGRNAGLSSLACLSLFLAQISYETAVAVPALCVLVDLLRKRPVLSRTSLLRYGALGLVTIAYLSIRSHLGAVHSVQSGNFGFAPDSQAWQLSLSAPWFLWKHFSMWLMPLGRIEFCSAYVWGVSASAWEIAGAWAWLLLYVGIIILTWKRLRMVSIGLLWFLAASFPPSNFIPIWSGPIEDYYLVFPGVGLVLALLGCARALIDWANTSEVGQNPHRSLIGFSLLAIGGLWRILCIPLFWLQADLWNRPAELYLRMEHTRPFQFQLQAVAANELMKMEKFQNAKELALKSHQTGPWHPGSGMILGYVALKENDYPNAEKFLRETMRKCPPHFPAHDFARLHLADTLHQQGAGPDVVRETLLPLLKNQRGSYHLDAIRSLIDCYLAHDRPNDALRATRNAITLHPKDSQFSQILAKIEEMHPGISITQ
jgi:hypothetical protein